MSSTMKYVEKDNDPRSSPERTWAFSRLPAECGQLKRLGLGLSSAGKGERLAHMGRGCAHGHARVLKGSMEVAALGLAFGC